MSATLNKDLFKDFFNLSDESIIDIVGRSFAIDKFYCKNNYSGDHISLGVETVFLIHHKKDLEGDILWFLPGKGEIKDARLQLEKSYDSIKNSNAIKVLFKDERGKVKDLNFLEIYSGVKKKARDEVTRKRRYGEPRRVILSTNLCETSVTLVGVK
eukprot:UN24612